MSLKDTSKRERTRSWTGLHHHRHHSVGGNEAVLPSSSSSSRTPTNEGEVIVSPASPAGTPPKKVWELKYRSFLGNRTKAPPSDSLDTKTRIPARHQTHQSLDAAGGSAHSHSRTSLRSSPKSHHQGYNPRGSRRSSSNNINTPTLFARDVGSNHSKSNEDSSVRGGKLFAGMFRRDNNTNITYQSDESASSKYNSSKARSPSSDELDGTLRRGVEKAYSPSTPTRTIIEAVPVMNQHADPPTTNDLPTMRVNGSSSLPAFLPPLRQSANALLDVPGASATNHSSVISMQRRAKSDHTISPSSVQIDETAGWSMSELGSTNDDDGRIPDPPLSHPGIPLPSTIVHNHRQDSGSYVSVLEEDDYDTSESLVSNSPKTSLDNSLKKKQFTQFHNEHPSESPFLGEDNSTNHFKSAALWANPRSKLPAHESLGCLPLLVKEQSLGLEPVPENIEITKQRMLRPFIGTEQWEAGRRYLIAPAVLSACPATSMTSITTSRTNDNTRPMMASEAVSSSVFPRSIVLGNCLLTYALTGNASVTAKSVSKAALILAQNYLLEFDEDFADSGAEPRGYAHLEGARARPHPDFADAVELDFYGSPCARSDFRKLVIRLADRADRDAWVHCLNKASSVKLSDLYDMDENLPLLGDGQYSTVRQARVRDEHGAAVALKIFDKAEFWKLVVKGRERADTLVRETSVQATLTLTRPDIDSFLRLGGFFETSHQVVLELELLGGTDLFHYISSKGVVAEPEAARITSDILRCLIAMNGIGVAHRDIKPANVLMCQGNVHTSMPMSQAARVKVCDFGMSTFVGVDGQVRGRCGTPGYVAPEIFTSGLHGGYGNKIDVYSAGVTLYVMLCGYEPFYGETDQELVDANQKSDVEFPKEDWKNVSKDARSLVKLLMEKDTSKRPSAKDALLHPWFRKNGILIPVAPPSGSSGRKNCSVM